MTKARDLANAGTALTSVSATELGYVDGVTSAIQTQIDSKEPTLPSQTGNSGKYLTTNGSTKSWGTVTQYSLPSQTGNSGKFLTTNGTSESWGTVNQPTTWTNRSAGFSQTMAKIATNGSGTYVVVGGTGTLYSSTDNAVTWTSRTSGFGTTRIRSVAFGNGLFVAVGDNGTLTTSSDGITWTARTANMSTNIIHKVIYANSIWVAVGNGGGTTNTGGIIYSTDGITWTRKSQSLTVGSDYYSVMWNGTNWIVGANAVTNNYLYASTPSGTWTAATAAGGASLFELFWDGTRAIIVNDSGNFRYSTSTTTLTGDLTVNFAYTNQSTSYSSTYYYNGYIYAAGLNHIVRYTPASAQWWRSDVLSDNPGQYVGSGGGSNSENSTIFAGSNGLIVANNNGIWTSF